VGQTQGRVAGKVAFVTGAAVRLAEEGADIIAVDLCQDIDTIGYPMATPEDLDETARLIEKTSQRVVIARAEVREGASIIATGSTAALMDTSKKDNPGKDPGGMAYVHSKRALSSYVHDLATELSAFGIRANVVHPTNTNTDMLQNVQMYRSFRPDLENPTRADAEPVFGVQQAMKVPFVESEDISNAVLWLASDEARYVTGMQLRVDAGGYLKWYDYRT
jgi:NAD(P)-dependent dehydrogenase (short-subunit alcohol dehydrogenase family)